MNIYNYEASNYFNTEFILYLNKSEQYCKLFVTATLPRQRSKSSTGFLFGRVSNTNCASSLIEHWMERPHDTFGSFFSQSLTLFLEATFDRPQAVTLLFRQQGWKLVNERFQSRLHRHGIVFRWNWKQWSTQRDLRENWKLSFFFEISNLNF